MFPAVPSSSHSGQQGLQHLGGVDPGEADVEALGPHAELLMVETHLMEERRVDVADMDVPRQGVRPLPIRPDTKVS